MTTPITTKYRTTDWRDYNAALKKRGSLLIWIDKDMVWYQKPTGKRGRANTYSESAIQFCLTIKVLYNLGLRQTIGFVESLIKLANLDWSAPDYSTLSRRQKSLIVNIPARQNPNGLHLLVDSTGIKILGEGEWKTKKYGADYRRQWIKVHVGIDAETLEIRAIEVTAEGAYDTKACHEAIAERGAEAAIPVRKNGKPWKETSKGTQARNDALRATERFGRTLWKQLTGYHRRSLVETKMHCFKLLGGTCYG
jgi:Transposase DDE domain